MLIIKSDIILTALPEFFLIKSSNSTIHSISSYVDFADPVIIQASPSTKLGKSFLYAEAALIISAYSFNRLSKIFR